MVVLKQNHVKQTDTMVHAATNLYSLLLEHTQSWSSLTSVENMSLCTLEALYILGCHCSDTAHALHDVKHQTLGLKQRAHLAGNHHGDVALLDVGTIAYENFNLHSRVESCKYTLCHFYSGKDAVFLYQQVRLAHSCVGDTAKGCVVAIAYILGKSEVNKAVFQFVYTKHNIMFDL